MAKENVGKFYGKLAQDAALAEKLNALDKIFAEKNEGAADDAVMREKAAMAIVIPLAEEIGLPFTLEELKEYEEEQLQGMIVSEDELEQVAGGAPGSGGIYQCREKGRGFVACAYIGVGIGMPEDEDTGNASFCIFIGGSNGPMATTD